MGSQFLFTFNHYELKDAMRSGMTVDETGRLVCRKPPAGRAAFMKTVDSGIEDCPWGRLSFEVELSEDAVCRAFAFADNRNLSECFKAPDVGGPQDWRELFRNLAETENGVKAVGKQDMLLYGQDGRYLYFLLEVTGGSGYIGNIRLFAPGDNFMQAFPEVYHDRNSFFHRYLSVFSSVYNDFQEKLDHMDRLLDPDCAPPRLLDFYAGWLGINVSRRFLQESRLRLLLKEAAALNRRKGTAWCIRRLSEIVADEKPVIVERSHIPDRGSRKDREVCDRLFGDGPCDVTLLYSLRYEEKERARLLLLLRQFMPVRCRIRLVSLQNNGVLDSHCYIDKNAAIVPQEKGKLDAAQLYNGTAVMG